MISPFNYVLGGFGMAFLIANKLAKRIAKAPSKISKRDKTQAKQLHKEYQYMRDDLRDTSLSVFDEILQANKDIIVPMLRAQ